MPGKKFHFKLEAVLRLRSHESDAAKKALGLAMQKTTVARQEVASAERVLETLLSAGSGAYDSLTRLKRIAESRSQALDRLDVAKGLLAETERKEARARGRLTECLKRQEAMENLKTHQRDAFEEEQQKADQRILDEMSVLGHPRANKALTV